jgi:hypothetical protein
LPAHIVTVPNREHDVENDQVVFIDGGAVQGLGAIAGDIDGIGLLTQSLRNEACDSRFVFYQ